MRWALLMLAILGLVGCTGPTRTITFEASTPSGPFVGAQVRAVPLDAGVVPLPLSAENFEEYTTAVPVMVVTDRHGRATLTLHANSPHMVEVVAPALGEMGGRGPWTWTLGLDGGTLVRTAYGAEADSDEVTLTIKP